MISRKWLLWLLLSFILLVSLATLWWLSHPIPDDGPVGRARYDLLNLDTAVNAYFSKFKRYPDSLVELTKRSDDGRAGFLADPKSILDPWHKPYNYDPKQLHPTN